MECVVNPVVGGDVMAAIVVTKSGIGVEETVCTDKALTLRDGEYLITKHIVIAGSGIKTFHSPSVSCTGSITAGQLAIVATCAVDLHHVAPRISDSLIVRNFTRVGTPTSVNSDNSLTCFTLLGSDKDHTIGTTGTVKSSGSSILKHCD